MPIRDQEKYNSYMKEYILKRYHSKRQKAIDFLGGKCAKCFATENLQFDHIDPKLKSFTIAKLWSLNEETFWAEIKKCQLLCQTCHIEKSKIDNYKPITHGKEWAYRKLKCRCPLCLEFKIQNNKLRRDKRKLNKLTPP